MNPATYAPMYAALYPSLAEIARTHGWALAVHGTLGRDMDLICVPWIEAPSEPAEVVREITNEFNLRTVGEPDTTHHGRERWTISIGFGECFLDLSFTPTVKMFSRWRTRKFGEAIIKSVRSIGESSSNACVSDVEAKRL